MQIFDREFSDQFIEAAAIAERFGGVEAAVRVEQLGAVVGRAVAS